MFNLLAYRVFCTVVIQILVIVEEAISIKLITNLLKTHTTLNQTKGSVSNSAFYQLHKY